MLREVRRLATLLLSSTVAACGGGSPPPPIVTPPSTPVTVTGAERIGWDQPAADAVELATFGYAIYVDGTRTLASGVACGSTAAAAGFPCTAALPPLTPGAHTLEVASFVTDGALLESTRSAALQVTLVAATQADDRSAAGEHRAQSSRREERERPADRAAARRAEIVADGLVEPTDLAVAPDGRLFVAERAGTVAIVDAAATRQAKTREHVIDGRSQLLAIAVDDQFERTHFVFAIYTERDRDDAATFTLARFREAAGTLGDRAVLVDRIPAAGPPVEPRAALRVAGDGTLVAAFGAGANGRGEPDPASYSGKLIRLNPDGTAPNDSPSMTPVMADGFAAPVGLAWPGGARDPWVIDRRTGGSQLREAGNGHRTFRLPDAFTPSAAIVSDSEHGADLLIASDESNVLLRVRFDPGTAQPIATERVTVAEIDGVRAMALGPNAAIYAASATNVWRLR